MALPKETRVGTRSRLSSTRALLAGLAATAVWLLDVDELPLEMKTAEEMDVPGAPVTPAPAHAECNRPAPQAREARELSPANRLLSMVTRHLDVPHLTVHAERPRAAVCVQHLRGSEPSESRESRAAPRPPPSATPPSWMMMTMPAGCLPISREESARAWAVPEHALSCGRNFRSNFS